MKILQKEMTFPEVQEYLATHKKYRLPTIKEIKESGYKHTVFYNKSSLTVGKNTTLVNVYIPVINMASKSSVLIKERVALVPCENYLEFINECKIHLKQADTMETGNILLKRMIEEYL